MMTNAPKSAAAALAKVDGWPINIATLDVAVSEIIGAAKNADSFSVVTLNVDHLVKLRHSKAFQNAYRNARFVTADGAPIAWLARRADKTVRRTTGADLVVPLAQEAAREGLPIYLFGTTDEVLGKAGTYLASHCSHTLDIAGTYSPPKGFNPESAEADAALEAIAASGARLCFLALGAPKQELLAARAIEKGLNIGFVSIGAALDFLAGEQVRAPKFFQDHGLEWSWRLITNPLRLGPRYASCALVLADVIMRDVGGLSRRNWSGTTAACSGERNAAIRALDVKST